MNFIFNKILNLYKYNSKNIIILELKFVSINKLLSLLVIN